MKKVVMYCTGGVSTKILVDKIKEEAASVNYDINIEAYGITDAHIAKDADLVLLGPQIRYKLDKFRENLPGKMIDVVNTKDYGAMDAKSILNFIIDHFDN